MNSELNFPPKLRGARSRLYRRRFLQVNTRWKALAEIYTMHSFAPFFKLKISAKNRHHFFAIEKLNFQFFFIVFAARDGASTLTLPKRWAQGRVGPDRT